MGVRGSGPVILRRSDCSEPFLTCGVPYLKLHFLAVDFDGSYFEVDANSSDITAGKSVVSESQQKTAFADALRKMLTKSEQCRGSGPQLTAVSDDQ